MNITNEYNVKNLSDICKIKTGKLNANAKVENGKYLFFTCDENPYRIDEYAFDEEAILISGNGSNVGHINMYKGKFNAYQRTYVLTSFTDVSIKFLFYYLKCHLREYIMENSYKGSVPYITLPILEEFKIFIPPLEVQNRIVDILEKYSNVFTQEITTIKKELKILRQLNEIITRKIIEDLDNYDLMQLNDVLKYDQPSKFIVRDTKYDDSFNTPVLTAGKTFILGYTNENDNIYQANIDRPVIIFDDFTAAFHLVDFPFKVKSSAMKILSPLDNINLKYVYYLMKNIDYIIETHTRQWISKYSKIQVKIPSFETQNEIVIKLDNISELTNDLSQRLERKIKLNEKQYNFYMNKLLTFYKE